MAGSYRLSAYSSLDSPLLFFSKNKFKIPKQCFFLHRPNLKTLEILSQQMRRRWWLWASLAVPVAISTAACEGGRIRTTAEGPFDPVTARLGDGVFRGNAVDLPGDDPRVRRTAKGLEPEQIAVSLSATHDSVWISWITGDFQIGDDVKPLDPKRVASVVHYGRLRQPLRRQATGYSHVYNQLYPFEGLQNYTSGIIHHVRHKGLNPGTQYFYRCGDPSIAMSDIHVFRTMPTSGPRSYP